MSTIINTFLLTGAVVAAIALIAAIGLLPIFVAKRRNHPSIEAISVCCIVGWLVWPAWVVALVWAYTGRTADALSKPLLRLDEPQGFPVKSVNQKP